MAHVQDQELFNEAGTKPLDQWAALERELRETKISPLEVWKEHYGHWKDLYERFREAEQDALYAASDRAEPVTPSEAILRSHRQVINLLLHAGDGCVEALHRLPVEPSELDEKNNCLIRIETLLASLRESFEIWHPANKEKLGAIRKLFS